MPIQVNVTEQVSPKNVATIDRPDLNLTGNTLSKQQINNAIADAVISNLKGEATPSSSPTPYNPIDYPNGLYEKYDVKTVGTYTNFKDVTNTAITVSSNDLANNNVQLWVQNGVSQKALSAKVLPSAIGEIAPNEIQAISGDKAFKRLIEGKNITVYNTWEDGYYYTSGGASTGTTYGMQRTQPFLVKKGQNLKFGINAFNTSGGSAAILNTYNLDGTFKANIFKHNDFLNQFKQDSYAPLEDVLVTLSDFSTSNMGQRYIEIHSLIETALEPINNRVKSLEENQQEILNGSSALIPEQVIPINVSSYFYSHNGQIAPTAYGHKRTGLTLLEKGQTVSYGVNGYTQIGSVAVLNTYNLDGTFKANIRKLDSGTIGKFFTGTYTASEKEYFGISDYADGAYGTAFVKILQSEPFNYQKGINYLLDKDKANDAKFSILNPSDLEAERMYQRGLAKLNLSATKDILLICRGQSNIDGRNPKETFPAQYLNAQGQVKGVLIWDDSIKAFTPFKFGLGGNTGGGAPGAKSESEMYGFDIIAAAMLAEYTGKTIYIVKRSLGGTAIDITGSNGGGYWTPIVEDIITGRKLIEELKIKVLNAMSSNPNLEPKAILSHQGEGDSTALAKVKYYQNKKNVMRYERGIVANPKLPYIFGTIAPISQQYTAEVDAAFHKIAAEDKFAYLVDMHDGTLFDPYHFDPASTLLFAQRVFNILKNL